MFRSFAKHTGIFLPICKNGVVPEEICCLALPHHHYDSQICHQYIIPVSHPLFGERKGIRNRFLVTFEYRGPDFAILIIFVEAHSRAAALQVALRPCASGQS